jgi:mRNA interferase RelE/StbE
MTWTVAFTPAAARQIAALPDDIRVRIRKAIGDRLPVEPKAHLLPLSGPLRGYGKFRVGPCRLICHRDDALLLLLVIKVDHRRDVYR